MIYIALVQRPFLLVLATAMLACAAEPAPATTASPKPEAELHGTLGGHPFWARLLGPDPRFAGNRMMELVYEPPAPDQLGGATLSDTPFLLFDGALKLVAWNGRDRLSAATLLPTGDGYRVVRELEGEAADGSGVRIPIGKAVVRKGPRGWDRRLAPLLLAVVWKTRSTGSMPLYDLFGPEDAVASTLEWKDAAINLAGAGAIAAPDAHGRLARLATPAGEVLIEVAGRTP